VRVVGGNHLTRDLHRRSRLREHLAGHREHRGRDGWRLLLVDEHRRGARRHRECAGCGIPSGGLHDRVGAVRERVSQLERASGQARDLLGDLGRRSVEHHERAVE
jgi:hypothetical protein